MATNGTQGAQKGKKRPAAANRAAVENCAPDDELLEAPADGIPLNPQHEKAIAALLHERTIEAAAARAGIGERTLIRWLKAPEFAGAYRAARREVVTLAIVQLQTAAGEAVEVLRTVATDITAPASSRVSAARAILDTSLRAVETEDLAARLDALEVLLKAQESAR